MKEGFKPTVIDNLSTGNKELVPKNVELNNIDICDDEKVSKILMKKNFDAVFHFAGSIIVSESINNPIKYYENNTFNSFKFLRTCIRHNLKKFIFSSTAAVYGIGSNIKLKESSITNPINPYGKSKLMFENILKDIGLNGNINYVILRYFNVAGADPNNEAGLITKKATHLIKNACEVAVGKKPFLEIYGDDYDTEDGTCIRDYIHISDLVSAHTKSLQFLLKNNKSNTFNCGYGKGYSVFQIVKEFDKILKKKLPRKIVRKRLGDPPYLVAENRKIIQELKWVPEFNSIKKIIEHSLNWEKKLFEK